MHYNFKSLIVFEDDDIYIINKPWGISSLAEHTAKTTSLFDVMKSFNPNARLCHRLDKFTSGCMIVSKNDDAYRAISIGFEKRLIHKTYHAVVHKPSAFENESVKMALVKKVNNTGIVAHNGKPAETIFNTLESFKHFSLVECKPVTGRFHQIRVHLQYLDHPIVADEIYGGKIPYLSEILPRYKNSSRREENPMIKRFALHAHQLEFTTPSGKALKINAPYPKDFNTLIKLIRKNDR
ncbi:MAG: RluA family pseudouridine synthase [Bacteroidia bacterium]